MFHLISFSPHFINHVSLLFPSVHSPSHSFHLSKSILFIFALFGCVHIIWSFNHIVSFTFRPIPSLGISDLQVSLDKFLILDRYSLVEAELRWFYYPLSLYVGREIQSWGFAWVFWLLCWDIGVGVLFHGAWGWRGSAGLFAAGLGGGGGLVSVPYGGCGGVVLKSASYLRFSVICDTT